MNSRPALDLRLAVPAALAWLGAAIAQGLAVSVCVAAVAVAATVAFTCALRRRLLVAAGALGLAAGIAVMAVHVAALQRGPTAALARTGSSADVALTLVRDPLTVQSQTGRSLVVADATVTAVRPESAAAWTRDHAPVVVFAFSGHWLGLLPGQRLIAHGRLATPRHGDTVSAVVLASGSVQPIGRPPPWQRWAGRVRDALRTSCRGLSADERGLLPGLVLGDVSAMPASLTQAFRVTGLTHLCAVSGANLAIVLGAVLGSVRRLGLGRRSRLVVAAASLLGFVVLVRPSPSVLRAAVMGAVVLASSLLGRRTSPVPVLAAAVLGLVLVDPFLARTPGFAMSVLATAAIVVVAPRWTDRLATRMPRPLAAAVAVPAAAQLACTPVIVAAFGQLTLFAVPANLLAAPAVAPATLLGIACALLGVVLPDPATWLAQLAALPTAWLASVARGLGALPGSGLRIPTGWAGLGLLALFLGAGWLIARLVRVSRTRAILETCPP